MAAAFTKSQKQYIAAKVLTAIRDFPGTLTFRQIALIADDLNESTVARTIATLLPDGLITRQWHQITVKLQGYEYRLTDAGRAWLAAHPIKPRTTLNSLGRHRTYSTVDRVSADVDHDEQERVEKAIEAARKVKREKIMAAGVWTVPVCRDVRFRGGTGDD